MTTRSDFPDWPRAVLCIAFLSLFIVSLDLAVEVLVNPSGASVLDRLVYRFGLMFTVSFVILVVVLRMFEKQLFGIPKKPTQSEEQ